MHKYHVYSLCGHVSDLTALHMLQRALNLWTDGQKRELPHYYSGTEEVGCIELQDALCYR